MEKELEQVLFTVAKGYISYDDCEGYYCHYCRGDISLSDWAYPEDSIVFEHEESCIVLIARRLLLAMDKPMLIYKLTYELQDQYRKWHKQERYVLFVEGEEITYEVEQYYPLRDKQAERIGVLLLPEPPK
jgi:hypothetical protein